MYLLKNMCISEPTRFEPALFKGQLAYGLKTHLFEDPEESQKNSKTLLRMIITIWY